MEYTWTDLDTANRPHYAAKAARLNRQITTAIDELRLTLGEYIYQNRLPELNHLHRLLADTASAFEQRNSGAIDLFRDAQKEAGEHTGLSGAREVAWGLRDIESDFPASFAEQPEYSTRDMR